MHGVWKIVDGNGNVAQHMRQCGVFSPTYTCIRIYICVGIWIDILVFAQVWANKFYCIFFGATWRGSKRTGKCYLCGVLCHSDFKINSFFVHSSRWCFLRVFLPSPFNQPTNEMKTRAKVFLPYLFLPFFFLARLLFALWQSSQKFCLASAISWRQLCVSPLTFAFVWIFRLFFLPFSCIGERRKTAIKESLSMHFPSRSALN